MAPDDLKNRFTTPPQGEQDVKRYEKIRETAKLFAFDLNDWCPESREKSLAITHLEEAVFWANAAIARHGGG